MFNNNKQLINQITEDPTVLLMFALVLLKACGLKVHLLIHTLMFV